MADMLSPAADTPDRTPQELAKASLELANGSRNTIEGMRAITMAIVALAGEVHALAENRQEPLLLKLDIGD